MEAPSSGEATTSAARTAPEESVASTESAGASLVLRYYEDVYRYAFRLAGKGEDAADLAQQTYLQAGRRLHQLRDPGRCRSWLLAIVRTCFLKSIQRRRPTPATDVDLEMQQWSVSEQADDVDREGVSLALAKLPESDRLILLMFYFEEFSYKEIAHQLDIPIGTVMSRLSRAKERMRKELELRDRPQ